MLEKCLRCGNSIFDLHLKPGKLFFSLLRQNNGHSNFIFSFPSVCREISLLKGKKVRRKKREKEGKKEREKERKKKERNR